MKKFKKFLNEDINDSLRNALIKRTEEYSKHFNRTAEELNNGFCEEIAMDVIEDLGGETQNLFMIDDGYFWSFEKSKYKTKSSDEYWNIKNFKKYGLPPFDYKYLKDFDLKGHTWIYSNGKHYDVETLQGVDNFWYLPIYQRQLINLDIITTN